MRKVIRASILTAAALFLAVPAFAQVVHSVQVGVGGFFPRGLDGRTADDVLLRNYQGDTLPGAPSLTDALAFRISDFKSAHLFGEWNVALGPHIEVGAGLGFYRRSVPSVYLDLVDENDFDIEQTLRLRVVPVTALVRLLPFGRPGDVQPYVGAGISALNFRYSEFGDFVDPNTLDIFTDRFVGSGTAIAGVLLGGLRVPLGGDVYGMALEGRYQFGEGTLPKDQFLTEKIDLSGGQFNVTFLVRF